MSATTGSQQSGDTAPLTRRGGHVAAVVASGAAALGGLAVVYAVDPTKPSFLPVCPLNAATGLWCPGCGATRSLYSLLHGDIASAFAYNPLFFVVLPFIAYYASRFAVQALRSSGARMELDMAPRTAYAIAVALVVFGVSRNIPVDPFTFLAPHAA